MIDIDQQATALRVVSERITAEKKRLADLEVQLRKYKTLVGANYVRLGENYGDNATAVIRFDGHKTNDPMGRLTDIAGTALHALLSAWIDAEFAALEKQNAALASRDLLAEVAALLAAGGAS